MCAPWTRTERIALAALVACMLAGLFVFVHPWFDSRADAAIYIASAKALLAGQGYSYLGQPLSIRPPGWSVLIAPVIALRGVDFAALNLYTSLWGIAALTLVFVWVRPWVGWWVSLAVCACLWLNPDWQRMCNQTMSDVPGIALMVACLVLERWASTKPSWRRDALLGLAIGLAGYVRTLDLLLAPAFAIAWVLERGRETNGKRTWLARAGPLLIAAAITQAPWIVYSQTHLPPAPDQRIGLYDYPTGMFRRDPSDPASQRLSPADVLARVPVQARQMLSALGSRMAGESRAAQPIALGALLLAVALFQFLRRRRGAGWFVLLAAATLLIYFDFIGRLAAPIWFLAVIAVADALLELAGRWMSPRSAQALVAFVLVLWTARDFAPRKHWSEIDREHRANVEVASRIRSMLPPERRAAVVMSGWKYGIYLDRPVWTLYFAWKHAGAAGLDQLMREQAIDAVVLHPYADGPGRASPFDPEGSLQRALEARFELKRVVGDLAVLEWPTSTADR
jgi:hypothetical protein